MIYGLLHAFLFSFAAGASTLTEEFSTSVRNDASQTTLVWNIATGVLHPTLFVEDWLDSIGGAVIEDKEFSVGDGSHGVFNLETYANFSNNGDISGQIIRIDTDVYEELYFTDFTLEAGWTIRPEGGKPLKIYSLRDIIILGNIDCSGADGENMKADPTTQVSQGGRGRCGGGNGGNGGYISSGSPVAAARGTPTSGNPSGGFPGTATVVASGGAGGGGGGSYSNSNPFAGANPAGGGGAGAAGTISEDNGFRTIGGGAGGGGGGMYDTSDGDNTVIEESTGGAGGGGGGVIHLYAVRDIYISGSISAQGGDGGSFSGGLQGGGGGGGGGGSVLMFAGRNAENDGTVSVDAGTGGVSSGGNKNGGAGSYGRIWITDNDGGLDGSSTGTESHSPNLVSFGNVRYTTGAALQAVTRSIDLLNTNPRVNSLTASTNLPGASTLSLEVAGSHDNFASDDTGFSSSMATVAGKRFVKFRLTLNNSDGTSPATVDSVTLDYEPRAREQFDFVAACGSTKSNSMSWITWMLGLLVVLIVRVSLYQRTPVRPPPNTL